MNRNARKADVSPAGQQCRKNWSNRTFSRPSLSLPSLPGARRCPVGARSSPGGVAGQITRSGRDKQPWSSSSRVEEAGNWFRVLAPLSPVESAARCSLKGRTECYYPASPIVANERRNRVFSSAAQRKKSESEYSDPSTTLPRHRTDVRRAERGCLAPRGADKGEGEGGSDRSGSTVVLSRDESRMTSSERQQSGGVERESAGRRAACLLTLRSRFNRNMEDTAETTAAATASTGPAPVTHAGGDATEDGCGEGGDDQEEKAAATAGGARRAQPPTRIACQRCRSIKVRPFPPLLPLTRIPPSWRRINNADSSCADLFACPEGPMSASRTDWQRREVCVVLLLRACLPEPFF